MISYKQMFYLVSIWWHIVEVILSMTIETIFWPLNVVFVMTHNYHRNNNTTITVLWENLADWNATINTFKKVSIVLPNVLLNKMILQHIQDLSERSRGGGDVFFKAASTRLRARAGRGCQKGNCPSPRTMYIAHTLYVHSTLYRATHYACRMYIKHTAWLPLLSHHRQWIWLTNWLT